MIYFIWNVFVHMAPFKIITLDDMWDQMNRSYMYVLAITLACFIDFSTITGTAIKCIGFEEVYSTEFAEDFCWTQGIYTIKEAYDIDTPYLGVIPEDAPPCLLGPGICPNQSSVLPPTRIYHRWYQFVQFYFWAWSCLFYMPYMMYICLDIAYVKPIIKMLHNPIVTGMDERTLIDKAARWLRRRLDVYSNRRNIWAVVYRRNALFYTVIGTKLLYIIYTVGGMYLTERMFKIGSFATYGIDWFFSEKPENSVASKVQDMLFPRMAACEIKRWGASGLDTTRGMCVLPQNVANSYIFLVFWYFLVLTIVGNFIGLATTSFKLLCVTSGYHRLVCTIFYNDPYTKKLYFKVGSSGRIILHQIADNVHSNTFQKIITKYKWLKEYEHVEYNGHLKTD
eukprot:sb/3465454/